MLTVKNLSKNFNGKSVLNNVSFSLGKGHIALFLGGSGTGKTTLLRILNGLESPDSGSIMLDNKPLDVNTIHKTHAVGMIFQQFNLFEHADVERNITLALEKVAGKSEAEAHNIAVKLLKEYGLEDKASMPIARLSGGEKQRLAIARALALNPRIICMDEPTSALDPQLTRKIAEEIKALAHKGYGVIIATHDMSLLDHLECTIYLLENGSIIQTAQSSDFKTDPSRFPLINRFTHGHK